MRLVCVSGRVMDLAARERVYQPLGQYRDGDLIDGVTVDFVTCLVSDCRRGTRLIIDNRVETVCQVFKPHTSVLKTGF